MEQEQELEQEQDKLTHILIRNFLFYDVDSEVNSSESMKQKGSKESTVNLKAIDKFQVKLTRLLQDIPDEDVVLDVKSIEKTSESERPKGSGESTTKLTVDLKAVERDQVKLTQLLEDIPDGPLEMPKEKEEVECDALLPSFAEKHRSIFKEAINKCDKEKLFDFCSNFNVIIINKSRAKKEDVLAKILEAYDSGCFVDEEGQQWSEELVDCCYVPDKPINSRCATAGCKPNIPNATFGSVFVDKAVNLELMEKESDKFPYLYQYYGSCELNVVVCCEFRSDVDDVHAYLTKKGVQTAAVHGGLLPSERVKGLDEFKAGTADVLVITGHLLLGQTFPFDVALINYDLPINFDEFKARVPIGHEVVTLVSRYSPHNSLVQLASELGLEVPAFITDIIRDPPPIKGRKSEKEIWDH